MSLIQHIDALKVLGLIRANAQGGLPLTYRSVAGALGRDPKNSSRAVAPLLAALG